MHASRFDTLSRSLTAARSRRGALVSVFAGSLTVLSAREGWAKKGKGKKGKKAKKKGTVATSPPPTGNPCAGQLDDTPCNGLGKCLASACNPRPSCNNDSCGPPSNTGDTGCCGEYCLGTGPSQPGFCRRGEVGHQCYNNVDCIQSNCTGYRCGKGALGVTCTAPDQCRSGVCTSFQCA
jgi:hypothetical protein